MASLYTARFLVGRSSSFVHRVNFILFDDPDFMATEIRPNRTHLFHSLNIPVNFYFYGLMLFRHSKSISTPISGRIITLKFGLYDLSEAFTALRHQLEACEITAVAHTCALGRFCEAGLSRSDRKLNSSFHHSDNQDTRWDNNDPLVRPRWEIELKYIFRPPSLIHVSCIKQRKCIPRSYIDFMRQVLSPLIILTRRAMTRGQ